MSAIKDSQEPKYRILTEISEIKEAIDAIRADGEVHALDFETTNLSPKDGLVRITSICGPAARVVIDHKDVPFEAVAVRLAEACPYAVFNAGFEGRWFDHDTDGPVVNLLDVGYMSKAKLGGRPLSLADMVKRDLDKVRDNKHLQMSGWSGELTAEQYDYAFEDAEDTYALFQFWDSELTDEQYAGFTVFNDAWRGTAEMEDTGMLLDVAHHEKLIRMWTLRRDVAYKTLRKYTPESMIANLRSKKQISDFLRTVLDDHAVKAWPKTAKKGELQSTRSILRQASFRSPYPFSRWTAALMVFNRADKYLSTYGDNLLTKQNLSSTGRIHGRFNIAQAVTGRYSSSNPNLQNIPRNPLVRRSFIAPTGADFVAADYSGIELRVLAELSGDEQLKKDVIYGNVHAESAITLFGIERDHFMSVLEDKAHPQSGQYKELRSKAKGFSFQLCIAEGQEVLTDCGLVPIEQVTTAMRVWDGVEFVSHGGAVYKGVKEVIEHDGLIATPDHKIFCTDGVIRPLGMVASSGEVYTITRTGVSSLPLDDLRVYSELGREDAEGDAELLALSSLQQGAAQMATQHADGTRLAVLLSETPRSYLRRQGGGSIAWEVLRGERAVQTERGELGTLRPARHQNEVCERGGIHCRDKAAVSELDFGAVGGTASGPHQERRPLRAGEHPAGPGYSQPLQQARVWDIVDAGPRRRFTVSDKLVHNCYGAGNASLAIVLRCSDDEAADFVKKWAERYPKAYAYRFKMNTLMTETGFLPVKSGRTIYVPKQDRSIPVASNYPIQGSAADVMYRAIYRLERALNEGGYAAKFSGDEFVVDYDAAMLATVHDELLSLAEEGRGGDLEAMQLACMKDAWLDIFPGTSVDNLVESAVGSSWACKP